MRAGRRGTMRPGRASALLVVAIALVGVTVTAGAATEDDDRNREVPMRGGGDTPPGGAVADTVGAGSQPHGYGHGGVGGEGGRGRPPGRGHGRQTFPRCEHPWPCGDGSEWPAGLDGPFAVGEMERIRIPVAEGEALDGVVVHPLLPDGVRAPVILEATPYAGNARAPADSPVAALGGDALDAWGMRPYVEAGYAYAVVSVLGTGASDGCFDALGPRDQHSLAAAVEWLAGRPWSNGRVGMTGYSWAGGTPFVAALADPPSLKTIVPAAIISNLYTFRTSPQGAWSEWPVMTAPPDWTSYTAAVSWAPPAQSSPDDAGKGWAQRLPGRLCPDARDFASDKYPSAITDERLASFVEPRILTRRMPSIRTSVFIAHGLQDGGHKWQEDDVWDALSHAPKRMLLGQWSHEFPVDANLQGAAFGDTWLEVALDWYDFWLKGLGEPPRVGVVDHEDSTGSWHASSAWPPPEANEEAMHLVEGRLQPDPGDGSVAFVSTRAGGDFTFTPDCTPGIETSPGAHFMTDPLPGAVLLSGNPVVRLDVSSDQPGGVFDVGLFVAPGGDPCTDRWLYGPNPAVRWISGGAIDLRYHAGNLNGQDLPPGRHVVRVDLSNLSHRVAAGERLGLWLGRSLLAPGQTSKSNTATITLHASSEIRLPLTEGTVGGSQPTEDLPRRPFQAAAP